MTLTQLIEALEDLRYEVGGDAEILACHQPAWPLAETIGRPVVLYGDEPDEADYDVEPEGEPTVWLPLTGHPDGRSPYAPAAAFDSAYC